MFSRAGVSLAYPRSTTSSCKVYKVYLSCEFKVYKIYWACVQLSETKLKICSCSVHRTCVASTTNFLKCY